MSDNPFVEPDDDDRTIIRPMPEAAAAGPATAAPPPAAEADAVAAAPATGVEFAELPPVGVSPLVAAAAPLLSLLARLRNGFYGAGPGQPARARVEEIRRFEQTLRDQNLPIEQIRQPLRALRQPRRRGPQHAVGQPRPMGGRIAGLDLPPGGAQRRAVLRPAGPAAPEPGKFLPVIELMYLCMSLGMQGRYRLSPRGPAELDRVREETYVVIMRQRQPAERDLSPHWHGVSAPYRPLRAALPVWVAALLALGLLVLLYALLPTA